MSRSLFLKPFLAVAILLVFVAAHTPAVAEPEADDDGFIELLNEDLAGWNTTGNWQMSGDGVVTIEPRPGEEGWQRYDAYLWHEKQWGDFILDLEYKHPEGGNSGVFFHVDDLEDPVDTGIEVQINDIHGKADEDLGSHDAGGVIGTDAAPSKNMAKPAGEWNSMRITCRDNRLKVRFNGEQVVDIDLSESGMSDRPDVGYLGFQDHGLPASFRNIRIKPLD